MNCLFGVNYLYMMKKSEYVFLLDVFGFYFWYLVWIEGMIIFSFFVFYLLFWIYKKSKGDKSKVNFIEVEW